MSRAESHRHFIESANCFLMVESLKGTLFVGQDSYLAGAAVPWP